jgi:hypothetical protein
MLLTHHKLAHATSARQILIATLDPKQEMQKMEAEKGKERQGEARRSKERRVMPTSRHRFRHMKQPTLL